MFAYSIEDIKTGMNQTSMRPCGGHPVTQNETGGQLDGGIGGVAVIGRDDYFPVSDGMSNQLKGSNGKRDLLSLLATSSS